MEAVVKDVCAVLRQKEIDLVRVRAEIEALRFSIPLLAEGAESPDETDLLSTFVSAGQQVATGAQR